MGEVIHQRWVPLIQSREGTRSGTHSFVLRQLLQSIFKLAFQIHVLKFKFTVALDHTFKFAIAQD